MVSIFQSTLRRTERLIPGCIRAFGTNFNPRSDERSDLSPVLACVKSSISIHAPTNGATKSSLILAVLVVISIHAPTNGATTLATTDDYKINISIHAPTNGATLSTVIVLKSFEFQSTLRRTERLYSLVMVALEKCKFQSTLRRTERRNVDFPLFPMP